MVDLAFELCEEDDCRLLVPFDFDECLDCLDLVVAKEAVDCLDLVVAESISSPSPSPRPVEGFARGENP